MNHSHSAPSIQALGTVIFHLMDSVTSNAGIFPKPSKYLHDLFMLGLYSFIHLIVDKTLGNRPPLLKKVDRSEPIDLTCLKAGGGSYKRTGEAIMLCCERISSPSKMLKSLKVRSLEV